MLDDFFKHLNSYHSAKYIHWNMRDSNYGFAAIEHRYRVLGGRPFIIPDNKKFDLARLLIDIYGVAYIGHPRLESLLTINKIKPLDFLTGQKEAEAFENRNFVALHQSTLRKVDIIANIASRVNDRTLKTNITWWQMHGGHLCSVLNYLVKHWIITLLVTLIALWQPLSSLLSFIFKFIHE